jgi:E3 ubiquitin-protein ligase HUWE1
LNQSELYHWIDVLDLFDTILEKSVQKDGDGQWALPCDEADIQSAGPSDGTGHSLLKDLLIHVISFTSLLIEHSFSRHLYNSMEHLTTLLSSSDMQIVLSVLNLLYVFSKRSNFISRLNSERRQALILRLNYLAEVSHSFCCCCVEGEEMHFVLSEDAAVLIGDPSSAACLPVRYE